MMNTHRLKIYLNLVIIGLLNTAGWTGVGKIGPDYKRPEVEFVNNQVYYYLPDDTSSNNIQNKDLEWWKNFNDPVLDQIIQIGLKDNLDLARIDARIRQSASRYGVSRAAFLPMGTANGNVNVNKQSRQGIQGINPFQVRNYEDIGLGLESSWEVDLFGRLRRAKESSRALLKSQINNKLASQVTLAANIAKKYYEYRISEELIRIEERKLENYIQILDLYKDLADSGLMNQEKVFSTRRGKLSVEVRLSQLVSDKQSQGVSLDILLGKKPGYWEEYNSNHHIQNNFVSEFPKIYELGIPSDLIVNRPDVRAAEYRLVSQNANIGIAQAEYLPKFTLVSSVGLEALIGNSLFSQGAILGGFGPRVSWRVFDFWRIDDEVNEARGKYQEALVDYKKVVLDALSEVETAYVKLNSDINNYDSQFQRLKIANNELTIVKSRYEAGIQTRQEVLQKEQELYDVQRELQLASQSRINAYITLNQVLGIR